MSKADYDRIVTDFRSMTEGVWEWSGRCCTVTRDGQPECCFQIVDGADLTFTEAEGEFVDVPLTARDDGMLVLDRSEIPDEEIIEQLRDGGLAASLECASHPTRPAVLDGTVVGVVVIDACNGPLNIDRYREDRDALMSLWQEAVDLTGVKPYYCTTHVREGWRVL